MENDSFGGHEAIFYVIINDKSSMAGFLCSSGTDYGKDKILGAAFFA